ncbi:hypothetical protein AMATHDRAFT_50685 [Amanita thiersii Skay4041]|uniref:GST N-terminal domain-containing protein n=1 Tax=Amanita thiersii Skay4041 TaxID=703135 RepID=A0A2A9NC60_9AGAR|nr:hypothetical protein AMATHDRAFT_50685 [Amanita thiersii Skay4041]
MSRYTSRTNTTPCILLYDLRGTTSQPWAPNIWRIRFILNYKRLRYQTVWLEFHDVENQLRAIGAPPSAFRVDRTPIYTLPVLVDPTKNARAPEILSNTNLIAEFLEATYPARPVFPEGSRAMQTLFVHYIQEVFVQPLLPIMVPLSHPQFRGGTQGAYGGVVPNPLGGPQQEQAWAQVKEQFDFLAMILDKNSGDGDATVAQGREVSYADFSLCSVLIWIERMAPHEVWARIRAWNGGRWARLHERCREYMDEL